MNTEFLKQKLSEAANQGHEANTLLAVSGIIKKIEGIKHWIQKCGRDNAIRGSVIISLLDEVLDACHSGEVDNPSSECIIKAKTKQAIFNYLAKNHNVLLLESDFIEMENLIRSQKK